jgi:hypothetical protein
MIGVKDLNRFLLKIIRLGVIVMRVYGDCAVPIAVI